jgi:TRAP-type C4-dicarboxylate transport system substrate-binding protein
MYTYGVVAIAEKALNGIAENDLAILSKELTLSSGKLDQIARADNLKAFDALSSLGIEIQTLSEETRMALEYEANKATEKLIESGEFEQNLYDRVTAKLAEYRNQ